MDHLLAQQGRQMVRTDGAARLTGLSISTLNKLRLTGGGPRYAKLGRTVVYDPLDLADWVEAKKRSSTSVAA
jgi:predicted DNA-binding transcriptional regulator AlpA